MALLHVWLLWLWGSQHGHREATKQYTPIKVVKLGGPGGWDPIVWVENLLFDVIL